MHIRDELTLRIFIALIDSPLHAYAIVQQVKEDGAMLLPMEERAVYRLLHRLVKSHQINSDGHDVKQTYRLATNTYRILKAHKQNNQRLMEILSNRLENR